MGSAVLTDANVNGNGAFRAFLRQCLAKLARGIDCLPPVVFSRCNQVLIDAVLCALSIYLAYQLRFDGHVPVSHARTMWLWVPLLALLRPFCLWVVGAYGGIWRYFNLKDAIALAIGATPVTVLMLMLRTSKLAVHHWPAAIPVTVAVIDFGLFLGFAYSARGTRRALYEQARHVSKQMRTLIVGNEQELAAALRQVSLLPELQVVGLLTPDARLHGSRIAGFTAIDSVSALPQLLASGAIDLVLVADTNVASIANTIEIAMAFGVETRLLPSAAGVVHGDMRVSTTAQPELVLNHDAISEQPHELLVEAFRDRVVLITGAGGSIGSEISRQVARLPVARLVLLDQDENSIFQMDRELAELNHTPPISPVVANIRDSERIRTIFRQFSPGIVLHAAAYKHVPIMEDNCSEAVLNNVVGTRVVAEAAVEFGAERLLMISTDKAVDPSCVMGATKRTAELLIQSIAARQNGDAATRCACVRFGNVMGSRGSVVPLFLQQIAAGGPITVTDADMTRYFMTIPEAVRLVLQAASIGMNGEIYMLDMGEPVKITTLARKLIEMSGLRPGEDIEIRFVGARPGEKLQEQLWSDSAVVHPTRFPQVMAVQPSLPTAEFGSALAGLEDAAMMHDHKLVRELLLQMPINFQKEAGRAAKA